jgi:hypothetical protein
MLVELDLGAVGDREAMRRTNDKTPTHLAFRPTDFWHMTGLQNQPGPSGTDQDPRAALSRAQNWPFGVSWVREFAGLQAEGSAEVEIVNGRFPRLARTERCISGARRRRTRAGAPRILRRSPAWGEASQGVSILVPRFARPNYDRPDRKNRSIVVGQRNRSREGSRSSGGVKPRSSRQVAVTLAIPADRARAGSIS